MARCTECMGVLTRKDRVCYVCGEPVPGHERGWFQSLFQKPKKESEPVKRMKKEPVAAPTSVANWTL